MQDAIDKLYATFALYRLGDDFTGCPCCVGAEHSAALAKRPLRDLTFNDLERYSQKAMTTWGAVRHFKYFLPRLLELTVDHRDDFLNLKVVFGKLTYAQWQTWAAREQAAVNQFLTAYWQKQLAEPVFGIADFTTNYVLSALANATASAQPFLDNWLQTDTKYAKGHLASLIWDNVDSLRKKQRLSSASWDKTSVPHREVLAWLQSPAVMAYLESAHFDELQGEFIYAVPQLKLIQEALASESL